MPLFESESLVLRTHNLAEADRIVVFLSRNHGIVRGVAKGTKRLKSQFGSSLEPFSRSNISFFQNEERELVSIQQAELLRSSFSAASEPQILGAWSYMAELTIAFLPPHDPDERVYRMIAACMDVSAAEPRSIGLITLYFETWLLRLGGFFPDISACAQCERVFTATERSVIAGVPHIYCIKCRRVGEENSLGGLDRELFQQIRKLSPADLVEWAVQSGAAVSNNKKLTKRIIDSILKKEIDDHTFRLQI